MRLAGAINTDADELPLLVRDAPRTAGRPELVGNPSILSAIN